MSNLHDLPKSWYSQPVWTSGGSSYRWANATALAKGRIKGIPAVFTPSGALHVGLERSPDWNALTRSGFPCIIIDLPPGMSFSGGAQWIVQKRHTRQLKWASSDGDPTLELPAHRLKQIRKGLRKGLHLEITSDAERILALHLAARQRKDLNTNESLLHPQLLEILKSPHQTACVVRDQNGRDIASAVFLHEKGRTIYAFGGQERSNESALATVMLIAHGIQSARDVGNTCFDFGGSMDSGVDKFYSEFGSEAVSKLRCIQVAWWAKPWLKVTRPDLFDF